MSWLPFTGTFAGSDAAKNRIGGPSAICSFRVKECSHVPISVSVPSVGRPVSRVKATLATVPRPTRPARVPLRGRRSCRRGCGCGCRSRQDAIHPGRPEPIPGGRPPQAPGPVAEDGVAAQRTGQEQEPDRAGAQDAEGEPGDHRRSVAHERAAVDLGEAAVGRAVPDASSRNPRRRPRSGKPCSATPPSSARCKTPP